MVEKYSSLQVRSKRKKLLKVCETYRGWHIIRSPDSGFPFWPLKRHHRPRGSNKRARRLVGRLITHKISNYPGAAAGWILSRQEIGEGLELLKRYLTRWSTAVYKAGPARLVFGLLSLPTDTTFSCNRRLSSSRGTRPRGI